MPDDSEQPLEGEELDEEETVDGLPVVAAVRPVEPVAPLPVRPSPPSLLPAVQAAAAAATGFVAGAAAVALVKRRSARRLGRAQPAMAITGRHSAEGLQVTGTRTFLVHVHVLGRAGD